MNQVFCPKCGSLNIYVLTDEPIVKVSMDDLDKQPDATLVLVVTPKVHRATCLRCGYVKEWRTGQEVIRPS